MNPITRLYCSVWFQLYKLTLLIWKPILKHCLWLEGIDPNQATLSFQDQAQQLLDDHYNSLKPVKTNTDIDFEFERPIDSMVEPTTTVDLDEDEGLQTLVEKTKAIHAKAHDEVANMLYNHFRANSESGEVGTTDASDTDEESVVYSGVGEADAWKPTLAKCSDFVHKIDDKVYEQNMHKARRTSDANNTEEVMEIEEKDFLSTDEEDLQDDVAEAQERAMLERFHSALGIQENKNDNTNQSATEPGLQEKRSKSQRSGRTPAVSKSSSASLKDKSNSTTGKRDSVGGNRSTGRKSRDEKRSTVEKRSGSGKKQGRAAKITPSRSGKKGRK